LTWRLRCVLMSFTPSTLVFLHYIGPRLEFIKETLDPSRLGFSVQIMPVQAP
jgi:hypothetical protein